METHLKVLLFYKAKPFCEGAHGLKVFLLLGKLLQHLEVEFACLDVVTPHIETQFELSVPKVRHLELHCVQLTHFGAFMVQVQHPLFELSVEHKSLRVLLGKELRDLFVLLDQHERLTRQLKPSQERTFCKLAVFLKDKVAKAIDCPKLIYVATSDPKHLLNCDLFTALKCLLQRLFKLSGRKKFYMHAVQASDSVFGSLV